MRTHRNPFILLLLTICFSVASYTQGPESEKDRYIEFDKNFEKKLFETTEHFEQEIRNEFEKTAEKVRDYNFNFEDYNLDMVYSLFQDFIDDTALNYYSSMYFKINHPNTGIKNTVVQKCDFSDPLNILIGFGCDIGQKAEYTLEEAEEVLFAIANEFSRKLREIGFDSVLKNGMLEKLIEIKSRGLDPKELPPVTIEDPSWVDEFRKNQYPIWDGLWKNTQKIATETADKLVDSFKENVQDIATKKMNDWLSKIGLSG